MSQNGQSTVVRTIAKAGEPDRYLAALLAQPLQRDSLIALAAFGSEIAHIPVAAHDPMLQAIRYQWWRDALQAAQDQNTLSGNPVADAVARALRHHRLPIKSFEDIIDAWDCDQGESDPNIEGRFANAEIVTSTTLFHLAAAICGAKPTTTLRILADDAGKAYAIARSLMNQGQTASHTSSYTTCQAHLNTARHAIGTLPRNQRLAVLPLALVEPYLHLAGSNSRTRGPIIGDISPLSRIWRIWWAYSTSRP